MKKWQKNINLVDEKNQPHRCVIMYQSDGNVLYLF